jgi:Fe2+ or Zn2+ uptake regulation protein
MDPQQIDVHDTADERLRRDGQRYTANRRALVDAMASADSSMSQPECRKVPRTEICRY